MKPQSSETGSVGRTQNRENGVFIPLFAGILIAFIFIVGLAVDTVNLLLAQQRLQRAVDAASLGATYRLRHESNATVESIARQIVADNLNRMGLAFDPTAFAVNVTPTIAPRQVEVTGSIDIDLIILDWIPGFPHDSPVGAEATAESLTAMVSIVLDTSNSMNATTACPSGTCSNLSLLKDAAKSFVDLFGADDSLALVTFNSSATVRYPMTTNPDKTALKGIIDGLSGSGLTEIEGGLKLGRQEIVNAAPGGVVRKAIVLFSDGAPTTGTGTYSGCSETYQKRLYLTALRAADQARSSDITVYAIGLGNDNGITNDPYQNVLDTDALKSIFLKRAANAQSKIGGDPAFPCVPNAASIALSPNGDALFTPDANQLREIFIRIGRSIRGRLID
jgi:hypothetical protein